MRSEEWKQAHASRLQEADSTLELGKATLASCASNVQEHAGALQQWLTSQQTDVPEPEDAHDISGMALPPTANDDGFVPLWVFYRVHLYQAHAIYNSLRSKVQQLRWQGFLCRVAHSFHPRTQQQQPVGE